MSVVLMQARHLLGLFLSMKRWKFLWAILVLVSLVSNHMLFPLIDIWMDTRGQTYVDLGAEEFVANNVLLAQATTYKEQLTSLSAMLNAEGVSPHVFIEKCDDPEECKAKLFSLLFGRIDHSKFTNYIMYNGSESLVPGIQCHMAYGSELNCPYLGNLAAVSQHYIRDDFHFKKIRFFSLTSHKEGKKAESQRGQDTMCGKHQNIESVYSRTIMLQCMLVTLTVSFYFLASTQSCIAELKRDGFLQLMIQKGLSVKAYWLVIGGMTVLEVLTFAVLYIVSLVVQCPGYFNPAHLLVVFVMALFYLLCLTEIGLLLSVTLGSFFYMGLLTVLISILASTLMLINRLLFSTTMWVKFILLVVFPLGHFGEFVQGAMLAEIRLESLGMYNIAILAVVLLLSVGLAGLILLCDFTNPAGNGLCLPRDFIKRGEFWSEPLPPPEDAKDDPLFGEEPEQSANVEPVTDNLRPMVRLSHLSKVYESHQLCRKATGVSVIKDTSALIYEGHITAVIGHNGAGKTTLLNLLTGTEQPTTGRVSICGVLVTCPLSRLRLRGRLGICPQRLNFGGSLTVEQTMRLTIASCGFEWFDSQEEVESVLRLVGMENNRNNVMSTISIGQKRKIAVATSLLGNPQVVFLDEPTSGLDPESRRRMWRLLQQYRTGRCIILSTQFMDEADMLADRKIFLSGGSIICAGSSLFLKSTFDCGFVFEVTVKDDKHIPLLKTQICNEFKSVKTSNHFGKNINFILPAKEIDHLPTLAQSFEKRVGLISAFGLLQASLYDIFTRLKDLDEEAVKELFSNSSAAEEEQVPDNADLVSRKSDSQRPQSTLKPSLLIELHAMIIMNVTRLVRTSVRLACRVIVPAVLFVALLATAFVERSSANHRIHLRTNMTCNFTVFDRAVCVYDDIPEDHYSILEAKRCAQLYRGRPNTRPNDEKRYLMLKKNSHTSLAAFLQEEENIKAIENVCKSRSQRTPCPIVYTHDWTQTSANPMRTIYIGSYNIYENFNSSISASITMGVFQKAIKFFTNNVLGLEEFFITAESVYDFRSTFIPTLGTFFQMVILGLMPATFLDDIIEDKESRVRSQLTSMGMSCLSYWLNNFIIHWLQYAIVYSLSVLALLVIVQTGYSSMFYMIGVFLPTLVLGLPSNQLMAYVLSTAMDRANNLVIIMYFFFSTFLSVIILLVQLNNVLSILLIAVVPPFATVALTFYGVKSIFYAMSYHESDSVSSSTSSFYFSQPHVTAAFAALIVHSIFLLVLLVLVENRVILQQRLLTYFGTSVPVENDEVLEDEGVQEELKRVNENPRNPENLLEVRHLRKTYPNGNKVVRDITFGTGRAEIFGLLGPNGAGKTTALSVVVGELRGSGGRCEVQHKGAWLASGLAASRGAIGYCPQYDPVYECVSAMELLRFYATILGVPQADMQTRIGNLVEALALDTAHDKLVCQLSVGNRRRLSLAISLLGEPTVVVIDEATTGVDPEGKRSVWHAIRAAATTHCSVVITTHSMEEVEAICNRVSVINRGLMIGLGTVQQLRTRYGSSYSLEILISTVIGESPDDINKKKITLIEAVMKKFQNTTILEEFNDRVHFSIPVATISRLSAALSWLLDNKNNLSIHYFSFHQMSMDQVFECMVKLHEKSVKAQNRASMFSILDDTQAGATPLQQQPTKTA